MDRGYIALWRKIEDNELWKGSRPFSKLHAWIDIIMQAQHSEKPQPVIIGMTTLMCGYGESLKSIKTWAERWGWTRSRVRRFFRLLNERGMISVKTGTITTHLTVCNYALYDPKRRKNEHQTTIDRPSNEHQTHTDKNVKNVKNDKKGTVSPNHEASEVAKYFLSSRSRALKRKLITTARETTPFIQRLLKKGITSEQIKDTICWLNTDNLKADYPFDVQSGRALHNKWDRIQSAMSKNTSRQVETMEQTTARIKAQGESQ